MRRKPHSSFFFSLALLLSFSLFSFFLSRHALSGNPLLIPSFIPSQLSARSHTNSLFDVNFAIQEGFVHDDQFSHRSRRVSSIKDVDSAVVFSASVLFPDWEILLIVSPDSPLSPRSVDDHVCVFQNNATSPASFSGILPFNNRKTVKCLMPNSVRRLRPFLQPILRTSSEKESPTTKPTAELMRWTFLAYEALSTDDDVVLFVKGVNHRQGTRANRSPSEFRCVFGDTGKGNVVRTIVTSSMQEVFRCSHPDLTAAVSSGGQDEPIKISLEIVGENSLVVPSVAYYTPRSKIENTEPKSLLCACTMVYNVGKFLKEWVIYHSKIGVDKFILYNNDSEDDLESVVKELNEQGYEVESLLWIWPKTQEAGFSHSAIYAKSSCTWMMYVDVDEFVFSPSWRNSLQPSKEMLKSLLPSPQRGIRTGQVSIKCNEYGPSNRRSHPTEGVTQGYNCRRRVEQRHKSIVLLEAVGSSLLNVIHHFEMKSSYTTKQVSLEDGVVNHYKYQAWPEFQTKFRRRVSAYVVDWTKAENLMSKDRAPGLGYEAIEPKGWTHKFCEVRDDRLRLLTQRWFGSHTSNGYVMAWQSQR